MDQDNDGKLSRQELLEGYTQIYQDGANPTQVVDNLMREIDIDRSGFIEYSGRPLTSVFS